MRSLLLFPIGFGAAAVATALKEFARSVFRRRAPRNYRPVLCAALLLLFVTTSALTTDRDYTIWIPRSQDADPLYRFVSDGKAGYIDRTGKVVIAPVLPDWGDNGGGEFHNGLLEIGVGNGVYVDATGKKVIDTGLYRGWDFSEGLAAAMETNGGKWGYIDTSGSFAISARFPSHPNGYVSSFWGGVAAVEVTGRVGYIDHSGEFVIAPQFLEGASFHDGMARVVAEGPCVYYHAESPGADLVVLPRDAAVKDLLPACTYTFVDKAGRIISDERYDYALSFSEGLAPVRIGKLWGYIDKKGAMVVSPRFDTAQPFAEGLAVVSHERSYGYIDRNGDYVIRPQFNHAESFAEGVAVVRGLDSMYWYVDQKGQQAFPDKFVLASAFFKGLAHVKLITNTSTDKLWQSGTYAYIDRTGKFVFTYKR
jgi:WG containing repeat